MINVDIVRNISNSLTVLHVKSPIKYQLNLKVWIMVINNVNIANINSVFSSA